jgi:hypothetical protein
MSRITSYQAKIRIPPTRLLAQGAAIKGSPCQEILRLALEKVVSDHGGTLAQSYRDNAGRAHDALIAVCPTDFASGIGVQIQSDGRVTFHYDAYAGDANIAARMCSEITQTYATIALLRSLSQLGFNVEAREQAFASDQKVVLVSGKKWSGEGILAAVDGRGSIKADFGGYRSGACRSDEVALRAGLQDQDLLITIEEARDKQEDRAPATWSNVRRKEIRSNG